MDDNRLKWTKLPVILSEFGELDDWLWESDRKQYLHGVYLGGEPLQL